MSRIKATGLKEIAYEVGLSINTVSRALRDLDDVAESTKVLIRQKAIELGYLPNTVSQFLKRDDRKLVAIAIGNLDNYYFLVSGNRLIQQLKLRNIDFTLLVTTNDFVDLDIIKQCVSQRVDALISLLPFTEKAIEIAQLNNLALILFGSDVNSDVGSVFPDSTVGSNLAASYLLNYHRINKLVYIDLPSASLSAQRGEDFRLSALKINPRAKIVVVPYNEAKTRLPLLIRKGYLGFYCFNDETAYNILAELNEVLPNVRRIYPNLHIVGFDAVSRYMVGLQDITSISYDFDLLASKTIEAIIKRIEDPLSPVVKLNIEPHLYQRKLK